MVQTSRVQPETVGYDSEATKSDLGHDFEWHTRDEKLMVVAYWWAEQRGCCCICHHLMKAYSRQHSSDPDNATIEHLIPRRDGGPNTVGNVRLAHGRCNHALGALYEKNRQRAIRGLPPLSEQWALNSARGNQLARKRLLKEAPAKKKRIGVKHCAANTISLPRGATLLPELQKRLKIIVKARIPAPKMSAFETAKWLKERGVRGA